MAEAGLQLIYARSRSAGEKGWRTVCCRHQSTQAVYVFIQHLAHPFPHQAPYLSLQSTQMISTFSGSSVVGYPTEWDLPGWVNLAAASTAKKVVHSRDACGGFSSTPDLTLGSDWRETGSSAVAARCRACVRGATTRSGFVGLLSAAQRESSRLSGRTMGLHFLF